MIHSLPPSLIEAAKNVLCGKSNHIPPAYVSFRDVVDPDAEEFHQHSTLNENDKEYPHIDEWKSVRDNNRAAINQLNLEHEHTEDDKTHVYRYTAASKKLNRMLYKHHVENKEAPEKFDTSGGRYNFVHDIKGLDAAIHRNKLSHPLVSYSGVGWNPAVKANAAGELHMPAYNSTSLDKHTAYRFAIDNKKHPIDIHVLQIHHPAGATGVYTHDDPSITHFEGENEYIMPRGSVLKLRGNPDLYHDDDQGHTVHVWHADRIHTPEVDTNYKTDEEPRTEVFNKGGVKLYKVNTLSGLKTHYPEFYDADHGQDFHTQHILHPVYFLHTPEGKVYQSHRRETPSMDKFLPARGPGGKIEDTIKKYPELEGARHLLVRTEQENNER